MPDNDQFGTDDSNKGVLASMIETEEGDLSNLLEAYYEHKFDEPPPVNVREILNTSRQLERNILRVLDAGGRLEKHEIIERVEGVDPGKIGDALIALKVDGEIEYLSVIQRVGDSPPRLEG